MSIITITNRVSSEWTPSLKDNHVRQIHKNIEHEKLNTSGGIIFHTRSISSFGITSISSTWPALASSNNERLGVPNLFFISIASCSMSWRNQQEMLTFLSDNILWFSKYYGMYVARLHNRRIKIIKFYKISRGENKEPKQENEEREKIEITEELYYAPVFNHKTRQEKEHILPRKAALITWIVVHMENKPLYVSIIKWKEANICYFLTDKNIFFDVP